MYVFVQSSVAPVVDGLGCTDCGGTCGKCGGEQGMGAFLNADFNWQTLLLLAGGGFLLYLLFFGSTAKKRRDELKSAEDQYRQRRAEILRKYPRRLA